jgi:hypothetical protein
MTFWNPWPRRARRSRTTISRIHHSRARQRQGALPYHLNMKACRVIGRAATRVEQWSEVQCHFSSKKPASFTLPG